MIHSELDAAGVSQPRLRDAYRRCRQLNARHGRTFFLATRLLAPAQRPAVHALYGFARLADDILDDLDPPRTALETTTSWTTTRWAWCSPRCATPPRCTASTSSCSATF
jgi:phytoene/squalene synthetase